MKRLIWMISSIIISTGVSAQTNADIWELAKTDLKTEYKAIIIENMVFSEDEAATFWPIFNEYMLKENENLDERMRILKDYAENYDSFTDEKIAELIKATDAQRMKRLKIRTAYYKTLKKALGTRKAAKLYQIDSQVNTLLDFQMVSQIPIIE